MLLSNQTLKGMVDLFPEEMQKHLYFENKISKVLKQLSYLPYETPVLEPIDIYLNKSSRELIEEQAYCFEDRGNRKVLLRPELTPSLARMVSKIIKKESTPLKLYSMPKCYRYERPQKGRMREFRQFNLDILSSIDDNLMMRNLEIFFIIEKIFSAFKVLPSQYKVVYNNRYWMQKVLQQNDFTPEEIQKVYFLLDRKDKIAEEQLKKELQENFNSQKMTLFKKLISIKSPRDIKITTDKKIEEFYFISDYLSKNYSNIFFSSSIVRGLDYYTEIVFEVFAESSEINRSLFGGGRYDDLLDNYLKKANISGIGFGLGVDIFLLFLEQINKLKIEQKNERKIYLAPIQKIIGEDLKKVFDLKNKLLLENYSLEVAEKSNIKNHFQKVEKKNSSFICFIGEKEFLEKKVVIKNLKTKEEREFFF